MCEVCKISLNLGKQKFYLGFILFSKIAFKVVLWFGKKNLNCSLSNKHLLFEYVEIEFQLLITDCDYGAFLTKEC